MSPTDRKTGTDEFGLIAEFFEPLTGVGAFNLKDDIAQLPSANYVLSKDLLVENVHFHSDDAPENIARKLIRANVSDIIAKGIQPTHYMLGCAFSREHKHEWIERFVGGLAQDQAHYNLSLLGGDTTRNRIDSSTFSMTVFGRVEDGETPVLRSGAKAGDSLFVSGEIGDSGLGLQALAQRKLAHTDQEQKLIDRYLLPEPPLEAIEQIQKYANAALDISDGLLADALHIAKASGVSMSINLDAMPVSHEAGAWLEQRKNKEQARLQLASFGDDYQVLLTIPAVKRKEFIAATQTLNIQFTEIGSITEKLSQSLSLLDANGNLIEIPEELGYNHYK